jgi:hypothetical protein
MSNPTRYASLSVPAAPTNEDPLAEVEEWQNSENPSVLQALFAVDTISNEIMTQVGILLKAGSDNGPLPGFAVKYLIMGGASQTGGVTLNYIGTAHPAARLPWKQWWSQAKLNCPIVSVVKLVGSWSEPTRQTCGPPDVHA